MTFAAYYSRLSVKLERHTPTADEARRDYQDMLRKNGAETVWR